MRTTHIHHFPKKETLLCFKDLFPSHSTSNKSIFPNERLGANVIGLKCLVCFYALMFLLNKDLNFQFNLNGTNSPTAFQSLIATSEVETTQIAMATVTPVKEVIKTEKPSEPIITKKEKTTLPQKNKDDNLANTYSNMTYTFDAKVFKKKADKGWKR